MALQMTYLVFGGSAGDVEVVVVDFLVGEGEGALVVVVAPKAFLASLIDFCVCLSWGKSAIGPAPSRKNSNLNFSQATI